MRSGKLRRHQAPRLSGGSGGCGRHCTRRDIPGNLAVYPLAHAVQALHLERSTVCTRHLRDRGDRAGVVRRELRVQMRRVTEQRVCAREIRDVGVALVRVDRVTRQSELLRALDLAVPVRALDEPHHEAQPPVFGDARHFVHQRKRTRLVRLHRESEAAPTGVMRRDAPGERIDQVERQLEAVALFGVDRQVEVGPRSRFDELPHARQQLGHHARALRLLVARKQRRSA